MLAVVLITPIREAFRFVPLDSVHWYIAVGLALIPMIVVELMKLFGRNASKDEY